MSKTAAPRTTAEMPQKAAAGGRVFKFSLKGIPPVDARTWAKMEAAARTPRQGRQYPEIVEAPDASI